MLQILKETVKRAVSLPEEPEARQKKVGQFVRATSGGLSVVLLLSASAMLAINDHGVANYCLTALVLASGFLLGWLRD